MNQNRIRKNRIRTYCVICGEPMGRDIIDFDKCENGLEFLCNRCSASFTLIFLDENFSQTEIHLQKPENESILAQFKYADLHCPFCSNQKLTSGKKLSSRDDITLKCGHCERIFFSDSYV